LPGKGYIDFEPYDYQQEYLNDDSTNRAINKARQTGMSTAVGAEVAWEITHIKGATVIILSKDQTASINLLKYVYDILYSVREVDPDFPKLGKTNLQEITVPELGSRVVSINATAETGRSFSASHWIFDEMAHTPYVYDIFQAAAPTVAQTHGRITVLSTPKGKGNLFHDIISKPDDYGFNVHSFPWWLNPTYNPYLKQMLKAGKASDEWDVWMKKAKEGDWYKKTRKKFSELAFKQEFECNFDADEDSVFNERQLSKVFVRNWLTEDFDDEVPEAEFWTSARIPGHYYSTGVDFGRKRDATVIITYDITENPAKMAEYKRIEPGCSWEQILLTTRKTYEKFESDILCDATGVGDVIYESIADIADPYVISDNQFSKNKYNLIENVRRAMDNRAVKMPKIPQLFREHEQYLWNDKLIVQDSVIANALAVKQFYEPDACWTGGDSTYNYLEGEPTYVEI
jgi:phage FluMu gp28-like protein